VRSYFYWSLIDNYEWLRSLDARGLYRVDFNTWAQQSHQNKPYYSYLIKAGPACNNYIPVILYMMSNLIIVLMLLCDFHIHTKYSDGAVELRKAVDLFGQAGFDAIAITDHVVNGDSSFGKLAHRFRFTVNEANFEAYASHVRQEAARAWDKYVCSSLASRSARTAFLPTS
jgi:hypothetical protein